MLGHPEAVIAPLLGLLRQFDGVTQGVRSVIPAKAEIRFMDGALVQYAQFETHFSLSPGGGQGWGVLPSLTDYFSRWATLPYSCAIIRPNTAPALVRVRKFRASGGELWLRRAMNGWL